MLLFNNVTLLATMIKLLPYFRCMIGFSHARCMLGFVYAFGFGSLLLYGLI